MYIIHIWIAACANFNMIQHDLEKISNSGNILLYTTYNTRKLKNKPFK